MQKVLITGAAGYLGGLTAVEFLNNGFEVIAADNFLNSDPVTYKLIEEITGKKVNHYRVDLSSKQQTAALLNDHPDVVAVIHFAALKSVPDSMENPVFCFENNNLAVTNLLKACKKHNISNFVFSSSCSVYGNVTADQLPVNEDTPLQTPESPYGYTKQNGEYLLKAFSRSEPLKAVSLRYFNPVGAHPSGILGELPAKRVNNLVPVITQTAEGIIDHFTVFGDDWNTRDGSCIRDYIHVADIARAHRLALDFINRQDSPRFYDVINLGSGRGVSVFEIIKTFERVTGKKVNYKIGSRRTGDVESIYSDPSKAEKLMNWKPEYSVEDMMQSAHKWQLKLKELGLNRHKL